MCENGEFRADSRPDAHNYPRRRAACLYSRGRAFPAVPPNPALREGTRDAVEAWDDGAAAFNNGESPSCLAYQLCRASLAGFDSGRALLAGGVMGVGGSSGEGARRPDGDAW